MSDLQVEISWQELDLLFELLEYFYINAEYDIETKEEDGLDNEAEHLRELFGEVEALHRKLKSLNRAVIEAEPVEYDDYGVDKLKDEVAEGRRSGIGNNYWERKPKSK